MPLAVTAAKGTVGVAVELVSGMVQLLAPTPVVATVSGISAPTSVAGMKIYVKITGFTASGTFTINGTAVPSADATVNVAALTAQQAQSAQLADFEYVSIGAYSAITNITTTGLTNGMISVFGIQAAKFNTPATAFKTARKVPVYSPNEHTGLMARDKRLIQTHNDTQITNFDSDFYGDLSLYWAYAMVGAPTFVTLPAAPISIVAAATVIASMTIAGQPTAPGMKLIFTVTTWTTGVSVTITGTVNGITGVSEVFAPLANGTYYSANVYSAISSIGGATNATTLAVTGVFGWKGTATSESVRQSLSLEHFDGSGSWIHPFSVMTDGDMEINAKAEIKLTLKGMAQDKIAVGDRTTNPLQVSRSTSIGAPLSDLPMGGWQCQIYLDPITGTAQTTIFLDVDEVVKVTLKAPVELHYTFNNQQPFTRAYPIKPECTVDLNYDIVNLLQNEQFRQNLKQYLVIATLGRYIGTAASVNYYEGWTWTLPGKYDGDYPQEGDPSKGNTYAKPKWRCEYDSGIGAAYQLVIITQQPPSYNT